MQYLLLYGGTPAATLARWRDAGEAVTAYRHLTDAMIGKRWVFDPDPLTLPAGCEGQVFRIDPKAPHGGDVVVTLVNLSRSWQDKQLTEGLSLTVRLPEAGELQKATWAAPSLKPAEPVGCEIRREGDSLTVSLPPVGAAGVLRLSR